MKYLHLPPLSAAENLAADEALLDWCEGGQGGEMLLFWEPRETFVVVGYANQVAREVNLPACEQKKIAVFRRCSGGGTVVQMPGGLNYSLILRIATTGPSSSISATNHYVMERNRQAVASLGASLPLSVRGHTDLCIGDWKFAGNAQRRRKNFLLFHGTLLLDCDLNWISELLLMPALQPDYRAHRPHEDFVTNLRQPAAAVKTALAKAWDAEESLTQVPLEAIRKLAQSKYETREWNFKF